MSLELILWPLPPPGPLLFPPTFPIVLVAALILLAVALLLTMIGAAVLLTATPAVAAELPHRPAAERHWAPPLRGEPSRPFRVGPDPFRRGQHRGVDYAAGGVVRAACPGRVVFAGRVAGEGTVSARCGRWRVTYAPLARVAVREDGRVGTGTRLGRAERGLHFGVRREGDRFGYVDPLRFIAGRRAPPPVLGRAPRLRAPRARAPAADPRSPPPGPLAAAAAVRPLAPWPVWLGLALGLAGLLGAGRLRLSSRRQEGAACRASSTSSSSPTIPSSR